MSLQLLKKLNVGLHTCTCRAACRSTSTQFCILQISFEHNCLSVGAIRPAASPLCLPLPLYPGHPLLEVRSRSLRSIVFKLNNDLLSPADLVREREFLAALLEWFNFEEWAMEAQVLSLLAQLAEVAMATGFRPGWEASIAM